MPLSKREKTRGRFESDASFNDLYPASVQALSTLHWTPLETAERASDFLSGSNGETILDVGSGVGKFCLAGAHHTPGTVYYGVEQRKSLVSHANKAKEALGLKNVHFIHGNFTQLDFRKFDHFYFYNSFYENLSGTEKIDDTIEYSNELYDYYKRYLYKELSYKPRGTKLCTLCVWDHEIPSHYSLVEAKMIDQLKFWIKD